MVSRDEAIEAAARVLVASGPHIAVVPSPSARKHAAGERVAVGKDLPGEEQR